VDTGAPDSAVDAGFCTSGLACSPACGEGSCCQGRCVTTLADDLDNPIALAVDSTHVYWVEPGATATTATGKATMTGSVASVPIAGGAVVTLASGQAAPFALAVDGTNVYWTNQAAAGEFLGTASGTVMQVPRRGGARVTLAATQAQPQNITVLGATVYWTNRGLSTDPDETGYVMKVPIGGGAVTTLAKAGIFPLAIAASGAELYWSFCGYGSGNPGGIATLGADGGAPVVVAPVLDGCGGLVSVDATHVYWTTHTGALKSQFTDLRKTTVAGGVTATIVAPVEDGAFPGLAALPLPNTSGETASHVYWTGPCGKSPTSGVCRASAEGTDTTLLYGGDDAEFGAIAVDATSLYWIEPSTITPAQDGGVMKHGGMIRRLTPR